MQPAAAAFRRAFVSPVLLLALTSRGHCEEVHAGLKRSRGVRTNDGWLNRGCHYSNGCNLRLQLSPIQGRWAGREYDIPHLSIDHNLFEAMQLS